MLDEGAPGRSSAAPVIRDDDGGHGVAPGARLSEAWPAPSVMWPGGYDPHMPRPEGSERLCSLCSPCGVSEMLQVNRGLLTTAPPSGAGADAWLELRRDLPLPR
eukprot:5572910-Amphidinium_carterae.1